MKRLFAAAALAAAVVVPAGQAGAIPPETSGGPIGWGGACTVFGGAGPAQATCRFTASSQTVGFAGGAGPGGKVTLSHKEKYSSCVNHVIVHTVVEIPDETIDGPNGDGSQSSYIAGVVYTVKVTGPGWGIAGGPANPAAAPPAEPADTPRDMTNNTVAGANC